MIPLPVNRTRSRASGVAIALLVLSACAPERTPPPPGVLVVSQEQQPSWIRNFNPLTPATSARWPTLAGIYEPLLVFNSITTEYVPWLALSTQWLDDGARLRVRLRPGVRWSDGEAFSSEDVVYSFEILRQHKALDRRGVWSFLNAVESLDSLTVDFSFSRIYVPGRDEIVSQPIIAEHVWRHVEDPVAFTNDNPVGTGPFTEVRVFRNQVFELGRNPHYWQEGRPYFEALRFPALPSNDRANLALVFDEVDWAGNFVPAIERVFVKRDPQHHHYWFPLTGSTIFLYAQTQKPPYDDQRVRKALSLAIDRELLVEIALYRYSRPADATALSDAYRSWHRPDIAAEGDWVGFDPQRAASLLDAAGLVVDSKGRRLGPDGQPWRPEILTVSGWSDWVRAAQVIARGLAAIGIDARVRTYDFNAWFQHVQEGSFDLSLGWSFEGPTPYLFYRWLMASSTVRPTGENSMGNWHRYGSPAADAILTAFERATDPDEQHRLAARLQRVFVSEAPAIPLYPNPSWAEFNTSRFKGFPTADDPYADPSPNKFGRGECLLVLTRLAPR